MKKNLLVVDDDRVFQTLLLRQLKGMGFAAQGAGSWQEAKKILSESEPDAIILDFKLPDSDAEQILNEIRGQYPVLILTGFGSIKHAVNLIRQGAADYLTKPVDLDDLELTVRRILENAELRQNNQFYRTRLASRRPGPLIGDSPAMLKMQALLDAVAPTDTTVLILGESGTGKEMVAQAIHDLSSRAQQEMVTLDSCGLQETLFESELFGHERGAFTGADRQKKGLIEAAANGTLFLDEIGDATPAIQAKLLRVMESGTFRRVGGTKILRAGCRIITATNRDIEAMSREGAFRSDLYYRLSRFVITIPPLRERREDIPALARHFLSQHVRTTPLELTREALNLLVGHDWPGNVRELKNAIERAVILARPGSTITPEHLAFIYPVRGYGVNLTFDHEPKIDELEKEYLRLILAKYDGNRQKTAAAAGISERNLYRLIERYGLS